MNGALEATCSCQRCNMHLHGFTAERAERDGELVRGVVVHVETRPSTDGEYALQGKLKLIARDNQPVLAGMVRESDVGMAMRFREHDRHCPPRHEEQPTRAEADSTKPTRPTGVWNRDRRR